MKVIQYIQPDGVEVSIPEADAENFDKLEGWERAENKGKKSKKEQAN